MENPPSRVRREADQHARVNELIKQSINQSIGSIVSKVVEFTVVEVASRFVDAFLFRCKRCTEKKVFDDEKKSGQHESSRRRTFYNLSAL